MLRQYLGPGRPGALLGSSGVGKSTIVNRLVGHDLLRTQDVRESDSRGPPHEHRAAARRPPWHRRADRHARHARAAALGHGRSARRRVRRHRHARRGCRFRDCRHQPGARVRRSCGRGGGELAAGRLESYHKLQDEQEHQSRQLDQRAQIEEKRRAKTLTKALRQARARKVRRVSRLRHLPEPPAIRRDRGTPASDTRKLLTDRASDRCHCGPVDARGARRMNVLTVRDARKKFGAVTALDGAASSCGRESCWRCSARTAPARPR